MVALLVVEHQPVVREGIRALLETEPGLTICAETGRWQDALQYIRRHPVDLVLLETLMPGRNGLELLKLILHERPRLPVVMLSFMADDPYALRALKAGASGYLAGDHAAGHLANALRQVMRGSTYVSQQVADALVQALNQPEGQPLHARLSDREYEILCRIGTGQSMTQIAEASCLSVKTISTYRNRILVKMALRSNAELIRYAVSQQLVF